jgi:hypothetical protein
VARDPERVTEKARLAAKAERIKVDGMNTMVRERIVASGRTRSTIPGESG